MKTSSRNTFTGKIVNIIFGGLYDEVEIELASGEKICGQLSHSSLERLGLAVGAEAMAMVKATEILIVNDNDDYEVCCRNQYSGKVTKLTRGFVQGEVLLETPAGLQINASITLEGANRLRLERGCLATAMFKSSNVMIAVKK